MKVELSRKAIAFIVVAIETEERRLEAIAKAAGIRADEDEVADATNDLAFYRAIAADLTRALAAESS